MSLCYLSTFCRMSAVAHLCVISMPTVFELLLACLRVRYAVDALTVTLAMELYVKVC